jgi:hypothetical protein
MDLATFVTIATSVVSLLSPYLKKFREEIAKSGGSAAFEKTKELYQTLKTKFGDSREAQQALNSFVKTPDNVDSQAALRTQLEKIMVDDEAFAKKLAVLLKEAAEANVDHEFNTTIYGDVQKLIQMGDVYGNVTIS